MNSSIYLKGVTLIQSDHVKFFHLVIDELTGKKITYSEYKSLQGFLPHVPQAYVNFISDTLAKGVLNQENITKELESKGVDKNISNILFKCISAREEEIRKKLVEDSTHISQTYLKDFDWKLQMTISSDKLSTIRSPTLTLNLSLIHNHKNEEKEDAIIELSKNDLNNLIQVLEKVNEHVRELKA